MSEANKIENPSDVAVSTSVKFLMYRSGQFRSFHADGAWANLDHYARIQLSLFNEHVPVPKFVTQEIRPDGKWNMASLTAEPYPDMASINVARQVECEVVLTIEAAKVVRDILNNFIDMGEAMRARAGEKK